MLPSGLLFWVEASLKSSHAAASLFMSRGRRSSTCQWRLDTLPLRFVSPQETGHRYGNFSMATMFPRREFTSEDLNKSLLELELAPSASVVLLPVSAPPPPSYTNPRERFSCILVQHLSYSFFSSWNCRQDTCLCPACHMARPSGTSHY